MLYHITMIIIFAVLAIAVVVLFKRFGMIQMQRKEFQLKEMEFMNKLVSEGNLKAGQLGGLYDFDEDRTINTDDFNLNKTGVELSRDEIHDLIFKIINRMSDAEIRQFYHEFQDRQQNKLRKRDRKDLLMIVDYSVNDQYYRDLIKDISESGVFIETTQSFSSGQQIKMTFMSPNYQKPFKIKGEIVRVHKDGVGVKFKMESQIQEAALESFMNNI